MSIDDISPAVMNMPVEPHALRECLRSLLNVDTEADVKAHSDYIDKVVYQALLEDWKQATGYYQVRRVFGHNFFGLEDLRAHFNLDPTLNDLMKIGRFPWKHLFDAPCPFYDGEFIRDTHYVFMGLESSNNEALTLQNWLHRSPQAILCKNTTLGRHENSEIAHKVTCNLRWYLVLQKGAIQEEKLGLENPKVVFKPGTLIPPEYEVSSVTEEFVKILTFYRKNGRFPYFSGKVLCWDPVSDKPMSFLKLEHALTSCHLATPEWTERRSSQP